MSISDELLGENQLILYSSDGELLPDPNLIRNISHLKCFIEMEIEQWKKHGDDIKKKTKNFSAIDKMLEISNVSNRRLYVKTLFNISTYYVTATNALDTLKSQLGKINKTHQCNVKKPKETVDKELDQKAKLLRNVSFVHQSSSKLQNLMDKRSAMTWEPMLAFKNDLDPTFEDFIFSGGKWWMEFNGVRTETEKDFTIKGITDYGSSLLNEISVRENCSIQFFSEIKKELNSRI